MMRDGPAEGYSPILGRAPLFLRVVQGGDGKWDCLDQLDDFALDDDTIYVYERKTVPNFVCVRDPNKRGQSGLVCEYEHLPAVEGESVRDNNDWVTWVKAEVERRGMPWVEPE